MKFLKVQINLSDIFSKRTLPVATRFNREPIGFLIWEIFGKGPTLGLCCRKTRKIGNFDACVVISRNFASLLQRSGQWKYYSTKTFRVWTKICFYLSKNLLFVVLWVMGTLWGQFQPKVQLYLQKRHLNTAISQCWVFKTILCKEGPQ